MSAKTGIKKIARRIQRKHRAVFNRTTKNIELALWVNDIDAKPSLHLGKRGAWNLLRISDYPDPTIKGLIKRRRSNKILSRNKYYSLSY